MITLSEIKDLERFLKSSYNAQYVGTAREYPRYLSLILKYCRHFLYRKSALAKLRKYTIQIIRTFNHDFNLWFHPYILDWNVASPALVYYKSLYPNFEEVFFPNYYRFTVKTIKYLIDFRIENFDLWIKYVPLEKLYKSVPKVVSKYLQDKKYLDFSTFYYIHKKYKNRAKNLVTLVSYFNNQDLSSLYEQLSVSNILEN